MSRKSQEEREDLEDFYFYEFYIYCVMSIIFINREVGYYLNSNNKKFGSYGNLIK